MHVEDTIGFPPERGLEVTASGPGKAEISVDRRLLGADALQTVGFAALLAFARQAGQGGLQLKLAGTGAEPDFVSARFEPGTSLRAAAASLRRHAQPTDMPFADLLLIQGDAAPLGPTGPVLNAREQDDRTVLTLTFDPAQLARTTAVDFLKKLVVVLTAAETRPEVDCCALDLTTDAAADIITDLSRPLEAEPHRPVAETFFEVAERHADRTAVVGTGQSYSYRDLSNTVRTLAADLAAAGLNPGETVAIAGRASFGVYASLVAVLAAGGVVVMIDGALPQGRQTLIEEVSEPRFVIQVGAPGPVPPAATTLRTEDWPSTAALEHLAATAPRPEDILADLPQDAGAYIFFTSGSTGKPKGVFGSHLGLAHFLDWQRATFPLGPGDHAAQLTALSFDVVLRDILYPLTSGATLHVPAPGLMFEPRKMMRWIADEGITSMHIVPSLMKAWLGALDGDRPFAGLRYLFFAGEPLVDTLLKRLQQAARPDLQIVNLYGPTETTLAKLANPIDTIEPGVQPIGRPQPGCDVVIMRDRKTQCGLWETGEITIRTPYRSKGYFNNEELTRSVFVQNPFRDDPDDLLYFTGDLGRLRPDGKIEIFGRTDSQIKIRGVRIEPNEIEGLMLDLDGVKDAAVTVRPGANDSKILVALVVPETQVPADRQADRAQRIREALAGKLHEAMVPTRIAYVDALPQLPNGKLDRKSIAAMPIEAAQADEAERTQLMGLDDEAREIVTEIERVLGTRITDLGKSFIALGGDSLSFIEVSILLENRLGELPERWEAQPLKALFASGRREAKPSFYPASWVGVDLTIVIRAIAIVIVSYSHTQFHDHIVATSTLFAVSGYAFAKFIRPAIRETGRMRSVWRMILKYGVPAGIWIFVVNGVTGDRFWPPDSLLIGTFFQHPTHPHYTFWFLDVLTAGLVIFGLIALVQYQARRRIGAPPAPVRTFWFDVATFVAICALGLVQHHTGWWNGELGVDSVGPFRLLPYMAIGLIVFSADTTFRKILASVIILSTKALYLTREPGLAELFSSVNPMFVAAAIGMIWVRTIRIPPWLKTPLTAVASSTLFIYIVNWVVMVDVTPALGITFIPLQIAIVIVIGILVKHGWERFTPMCRSVCSRAMQAARPSRIQGPRAPLRPPRRPVAAGTEPKR